MPVRRNQRGMWIYRTTVKLPDGKMKRIFGTPSLNTKVAAQKAEREHIERALKPLPQEKKEVPTFADWFWGSDADATEPNGRFWNEWVISRKNKPSEANEKKSIYKGHLKQAFGKMRLDQIGVSEIAQFRAKLVKAKLSDKRSTTSSPSCRSRCVTPPTSV